MVLLSGGNLIAWGEADPLLGSRLTSPGRYIEFPPGSLGWTDYNASYAHIYERQLWVYVVVSKRAKATARLPLKVYRRGEDGRSEVRDHPLAQLLRQPNPRQSAFQFWLWTSSTLDTFGEALWVKTRNPAGQVRELWPMHPSKVVVTVENGRKEYLYGPAQDVRFPVEDVVHFRSYSPTLMHRGMSPLEPLRRTLENEDASRRATSSFWRNGARPGFALTHSGNLSEAAADRLRRQWEDAHAGADNIGRTVILEEGMKPETLTITAEEAQYIDSRKLNREEVCGAYDVPPPVVHILDRATFSNITEQMRSMYRDTMAPHLKGFEEELASQLRDDFDDDVYCEFLMDDVLRGAFETRVDSYQAAINAGWLTPNEVRRLENLPEVEGADQLYRNGALTAIEPEDQEGEALPLDQRIEAAGALIRAGFDPNESLAAVGLDPITHTGMAPVTLRQEEEPQPAVSAAAVRTVMGRLSWQKSLEQIDPAVLTSGLNGSGDVVRRLLAECKANNYSVDQFKELVKTRL